MRINVEAEQANHVMVRSHFNLNDAVEREPGNTFSCLLFLARGGGGWACCCVNGVGIAGLEGSGAREWRIEKCKGQHCAGRSLSSLCRIRSSTHPQAPYIPSYVAPVRRMRIAS